MDGLNVVEVYQSAGRQFGVASIMSSYTTASTIFMCIFDQTNDKKCLIILSSLRILRLDLWVTSSELWASNQGNDKQGPKRPSPRLFSHRQSSYYEPQVIASSADGFNFLHKPVRLVSLSDYLLPPLGCCSMENKLPQGP